MVLLGPLEARRHGEPLELGGTRPRALLAFLALNIGTVVSFETLVEGIWGEKAPKSSRHMVAVYISRLRKTLGTDALLTRRPGYVLGVEPDQLDIVRFQRLISVGRASSATKDHAAAAECFSEALALWRGPALADLVYEPFAQGEIAHLEELRLETEEEWIEAELALGETGSLVAEIERFVAAAPLRERRRAHQMLALYRSGRQAEALAAYQDARRTFVEELGLEPGPGLRALERTILAQDDRLLREPRVSDTVTLLGANAR